MWHLTKHSKNGGTSIGAKSSSQSGMTLNSKPQAFLCCVYYPSDRNAANALSRKINLQHFGAFEPLYCSALETSLEVTHTSVVFQTGMQQLIRLYLGKI